MLLTSRLSTVLEKQRWIFQPCRSVGGLIVNLPWKPPFQLLVICTESAAWAAPSPTNNNTTTYIEPANKDVCISNPFKQSTAYVRPLNVSSHLFIDTLLVLLDLLAAIKCTWLRSGYTHIRLTSSLMSGIISQVYNFIVIFFKFNHLYVTDSQVYIIQLHVRNE